MNILRRLVCAIVGHRWILRIDFYHGYQVTQRIACLRCWTEKRKPSPAEPEQPGE